MSMPPNLELDFQDYAPQHDFEADDGTTTGDRYQQLAQPKKVTINIPTTAAAPTTKPTGPRKDSSFGNILQSFAGFQSSSFADDLVNRAVWSQSDANQQRPETADGGWILNYLVNYFDITTEDVLQKIIWSALPVRKTASVIDSLDDMNLIAPLATLSNDASGSRTDAVRFDSAPGGLRSYSYIERFIQGRPDFYGPLWISTTLIFVVAIFSNIGSYMSFRANLEESSSTLVGTSFPANMTVESAANVIDKHINDWHYSMEELSMASSLVTSYVIFMPVFLWLLFWFRGCTRYYTLSEMLSAYGYSLSIFVPTAILLTIQASYFRYPLLALATITSGTVLTLSFLPVTKSDPNPRGSDLILLLSFVCHCFMAYCIHRIMLQ